MTKDEMKNRISLALKDSILQQGFEIICKENAELQKKIRCECTRCVYSDSPCIRSDYGVENDEDVCPNYKNIFVAYTQLKEENAELRKVAEFQQSSNMSRHFENKKLKEGLVVGSTFNKALNSMNKSLEEERDKYRNMVFDKDDQLTKAKFLLKQLADAFPKSYSDVVKDTLEESKKFVEE